MLGKETNEDMLKAMDVFGGGLGAHGEACGALIGALAVVGLIFGRSEGGQYPDTGMWKYAHEMTKRFRNEVTGGRILCRDIAGVDWTKADQVKAFREGTKRKDCGILTGKTARLLGETIDRAMKEKAP
jgi:C_GCAxxG_C_C family probable redox protein